MKLVKEEEEERGKRRWFVLAMALFLLILVSGLAATAFLFSCGVGEDTKDRWVEEVEGYPTWEELVDQIKEAEQSDGKLVKVEVIGRSLEGRPIHSVSVSGSGNKGQPLVQQLPLVWIVCGLHAREWVSPQACVHILQALIQNLPSEPELQKAAFRIVPLANPDGYVFSMSGQLENRLARKNQADSGCPLPLFNGVDLNRNFPVGFNLSTDSNCDLLEDSRDGFCGGCSNTFGGQHPFSEPETEALRSGLTELAPWIFIDIHASLGAWLTPPVSRQSRPGEHHAGWNLDFLTDFLKSKFNVTYSTDQASSLLGKVGGTMLDWVYEDLGVARAYALELLSGCQGDETPLCLFQCPVKVARDEVLPPVWAAIKLLVKEAWHQDFSPPRHNNRSSQQKR